MSQYGWEPICHPSWGTQQASGGTLDIGQLREMVDAGRWTTIMIGPESEACAVEIWPGGKPAAAFGTAVPEATAWQRRIIVSNRRPWSGVIEAPFDIYPVNPFPGSPASSLAASYVHRLQLYLHDGVPPILEPRRNDARYFAALTALTATAETVLARIANPGRAGGRLTLNPSAMTGGETNRVRLYGVVWNTNGIYESSVLFDQTFVAADSGLEFSYHWEGRFDGYKLTYLGAGTPSFNLDYDLLLRDEQL